MNSVLQEYSDFLNNTSLVTNHITEEKILEHFDEVGAFLSYLIFYPDVFIDIITPSDNEFQLYPFQRLSLRAKMRYRQIYETMNRGAAKSFLSFISRYLTCMVAPGHTSFVTTDVKEQAVAIAKEKIQDELWVLFPLLANEMRKWKMPGGSVRGPVGSGKGYASYRFTNGSRFDVVGIDSARGKRRHSGLIEEVIEQDQLKINEKIIPLMSIGRRDVRGRLNPYEPFNAQKIYITSAGFKNTFAYAKMIETLIMSVLFPSEYLVLTLDYKIPLMHGLISQETIREVRANPTYSPESFAREFNSKWSGEIKGAALTYNVVKEARRMKRADYVYRAQVRDFGEEFYVLGVDAAKDGAASTVLTVLKIIPTQFHYIYTMVAGEIIDNPDYSIVSNVIKEYALDYRARLVVIDATGVGSSIRDWLNKPSTTEAGRQLPGFGILNLPKNSEGSYIKYRENNVVYEVKSTASLNSEINSFFFSRIKSGSFRMLIPFVSALESLKSNKTFLYATDSEKQRILKPYQITDKLEQELLNLDIYEAPSGSTTTGLRVMRRDLNIQKDIFSATSYAMFGTHVHLELPYYKKRSRKTRSFTDYVMISTVGGDYER